MTRECSGPLPGDGRPTAVRHPLRHPAVRGGVVAAGVLLASGCGAGLDATTSSITSSGVGVTQYEDRIRILNALAFPPVPPLRPAPVLSVGIANDGSEPDRLTGIEVVTPEGLAPAWVEVLGPQVIPAGGMLLIGARSTPTAAYLCGTDLGPGEGVTLTFRFARAEPVTNLTTVVAPVGSYWSTGGLAVQPDSSQPAPAAPCARRPDGAAPPPIGG